MKSYYYSSLIILVSLVSCDSNQERLKEILVQYDALEKTEAFNLDFDYQIQELRDEAVLSNDTAILFSLDSLVVLGIEAPEYLQTLEDEILSIDTVLQRRCHSIDDGPKDAVRVKSNNRLSLPRIPRTIPVAIHVIQSRTGDGHLSEDVIQAQMKVLNDNFKNTLFQFNLASVDSIKQDDWYLNVDLNNIHEKAMHQRLSIDPETTLNAYYVGNIGPEGYLGYAKFPWKDRTQFDGVVIFNGSVPGSSSLRFNEGKTLAHEVGHYLGLFHTFHKGCNVGDAVSDTPAQGLSTDGCPTGKDSCPKMAGEDPIHNFMDYSDDSCMTEFTPGQNNRMNWAVRRYRTSLGNISI